MKYIDKQTSPQFFENWKKNNDVETPEKAALKNWGILQKPEKGMLREHLLKEQGYLCCYCNQSIKTEPIDTLPLRAKIEHLEPKDEDKYPEKKFTYENLLLACNGGERDRPVVQHCDTKKGNKEPTPIHPLQHDCEEFFIYKKSGEIEGISEDANTTICKLGLDIPKLNLLRKTAINFFIDQYLMKSEEEITLELQLLVTKVEDKFSPFCMAVYKFIKEN